MDLASVADAGFVLALLTLGCVMGVLAGMLGIGGGMIAVPFLMLLLAPRGIAPEQLVKVAIATSLTTILFTSAASVRAHHARGAVRWDLVALLAPGIVLGALAGARLIGWAANRPIEFFFAGFIGWSASRMVRRPAVPVPGTTPRSLPGKIGMLGAGAVIGVLSAVLGAGGGFMTVPFLSDRGLRIQHAIATSAACGLPISAGGALGYAWAGHGLTIAPGMLGYIHLPALTVVALASTLCAPLGVQLAHRLPVGALRRVFGILLWGLAADMLWKALH
jgi:uncharacterized membrane protein YfcA